MKVDFAKFERSLPYASELYGIYQPLLGWKSRLRTLEILEQVDATKLRLLNDLRLKMTPVYDMSDRKIEVGIGKPTLSPRSALDGVDGIVARRVRELVADGGFTPESWEKYTSEESLLEILADSSQEIESEVLKVITAVHGQANPAVLDPTRASDARLVLESILQRESTVAGALRSFSQERSPAEIAALMMPAPTPPLIPLLSNLSMITPSESDLADATISPIGLVRLYRQYFFEFDTFLGPPVQHLWLSPGGTVELVETSTRRTLVEQTTEQGLETTTKSERSTTDETEISDAIRSENNANTKLGVTLSSTGNYTVGFVSGSTQVGTSYNVEKSSKEAREETHRTLRQQTEKLSSEIRKNYKSTFKTVTETTDTQSRRYVIQNTTKTLMNYELRRKMRQVGVQVQDYGLHLCWQAYVEAPGAELGTAKLIHIAAPADLQGTKEPEAPVMPEPEIRDKAIPVRDIPFGVYEDSGIAAHKFRALTAEYLLVPPKPGYIYSRAEVVLTGEGRYADLRAYPQDTAEAINFGASDPPNVKMIPTGDPVHPEEPSVQSFVLGFQLDSPRTGDGHNYFWHVEVTVIWKPSQQLLNGISSAYAAAVVKFNEATERANKKALHTEAQARVKAASKIKPRSFEELRDEERIIVYRNLVRKLLIVAGITDPANKTNEDAKLRHVFSEVVESMFDIDKMLYFVAPEWWRPRRYSTTPQRIGLVKQPKAPEKGYVSLGKVKSVVDAEFDAANTTNWDGGRDRPSSYYITEDSAPARMGSSLGWLLQLDGDNSRNAFLNAPWVKAVIPIRAGHEWKALAWLSNAAIEGSEGLEDNYQANDAEKQKILTALKSHVWEDPTLTTLYAAMNQPDQIRIIDAIRYLILHVQELHATSLKPVPNPDEPTMSYLPTDEVFERGFDPLPGGFKAAGTEPFRPFDQWVEVLPTDQIVPVEVKYDPITGMQT